MKQYIDLLKFLGNKGDFREYQTGLNTIGIFGYQMRFDLSEGFPLLTTRKIPISLIIHEILWFLSEIPAKTYHKNNGVKFWGEFSEIPMPIEHFSRWHSWGYAKGNSIENLKSVVYQLCNNSNTKRALILEWKPFEFDKNQQNQITFRFHLLNGILSCELFQSSVDAYLGLPFNLPSYALMASMVAIVSGYNFSSFVYNIGDLNMALDQKDSVLDQISKPCLKLPKMDINSDIKNIFDFKIKDFNLSGYNL